MTYYNKCLLKKQKQIYKFQGQDVIAQYETLIHKKLVHASKHIYSYEITSELNNNDFYVDSCNK